MSRILFVAQETGGIGKSTIVRALAEAVPDAKVVEIESVHRLLDLEKRTTFFPVRADRDKIEKTGGEAAQQEFDAAVDHLVRGTLPTIVDIGANASSSLLSHVRQLAPAFARRGRELGVVVVVANEAGAIADAARLVDLVTPWCKSSLFVVENGVRGAVDPGEMKALTKNAVRSELANHIFSEEAKEFLQSLGLGSIAQLDDKALEEKYGPSRAMRIQRQLEAFRLDAMKAVRASAEWLVG